MIVQTVEKFAVIEEVNKIVVVVSKPWMTHARDLFRDKPYLEKLIFCEGGAQGKNPSSMHVIA